MYEMGQEEIDAVTTVLRSGRLFRYRGGEGGQSDSCEKRINEMIGSAHSLVMTSGTGALICGLAALGIGPGDEVIVPAYTWLASAGAVLSVGAIPVLADVDETLTLDPLALERSIGPRTKAVIPVHMGGRPSKMDQICAIARKHGLVVLEDACQAIGGSFQGKRLGTLGDAGAFSFNQFKIITCGEGGALLTSSRKVYERALYNHDMGCMFRGKVGTMTEEPFLGNTFRMTEILSAVLRVQLDRLDGILARLRERHTWMLDVVRSEKLSTLISPSADAAGDCGVFATFLFGTSAVREQVAARALELDVFCALGSPINHGLHVYTNWTVLLNRQGGHHPATNPFLRPENKDCRLDITPDCCLKTLEILGRTGVIEIDPRASRETCEGRARAFCQAAREVLS